MLLVPNDMRVNAIPAALLRTARCSSSPLGNNRKSFTPTFKPYSIQTDKFSACADAPPSCSAPTTPSFPSQPLIAAARRATRSSDRRHAPRRALSIRTRSRRSGASWACSAARATRVVRIIWSPSLALAARGCASHRFHFAVPATPRLSRCQGDSSVVGSRPSSDSPASVARSNDLYGVSEYLTTEKQGTGRRHLVSVRPGDRALRARREPQPARCTQRSSARGRRCCPSRARRVRRMIDPNEIYDPQTPAGRVHRDEVHASRPILALPHPGQALLSGLQCRLRLCPWAATRRSGT